MGNIYFLFFAFILMLAPGCKTQMEAERVPSWAKEAVWYQIFPERFNNGDINNDPAPVDMQAAWPFEFAADWKVTPWTSDWYSMRPWEKNTGKDFYWNVGTRRYGGDIQGILDKLDYLEELGINAIYLNPVFEAPSLHKYDAATYRHIDDNFGPDPYGDKIIVNKENPADETTWQWTSADKLFLKLIKECHNRDIKIIIDGVFNHCGTSFWAFRDVMNKQQKSDYAGWFTIKEWDSPDTEENEFDWEGWYGIRSLPELKENEQGLIDPIVAHLKKVVKRWMDPNGDGNPEDGIDGWRLDVADMVNINFWKKFRVWVKNINPDAYITGEVWWKDWDNNVMTNASDWLKGDAFDAVMNYRFGRAVKHLVINEETKITPSAFIDSLKNLQRDYHPENLAVLMNYFGSHDTERLATMAQNPEASVDHLGIPDPDRYVNIQKPSPDGYKKMKLAAAMQLTLPGAPAIYYGDEAGMWGPDDPDCRKPMVWPGLEYENESGDPFGRKRNSDEVKFNEDIFNWYKKIIGIRNSNEAFSIGTLKFFLIDDDNNLLGYQREWKDQEFFVIVNSSDKSVKTTLPLKEINKKDKMKDLISNKVFSAESGEYTFNLPPFSVLILN